MLLRKMARDIWGQKGTYAACIMIMVIGLMTFNLFSIGYDNFTYSREVYYGDMNFAEGFASIKGMPASEIKKLEKLDEIKEINGRLVRDVRIIQDGNEANAYLRLVSFLPGDEAQLNKFELQSGSTPKNGRYEIVLDSKYFEATKRELGDTIPIAAAGQVVDLTVSGSGRSPEYIYALRTDQDLYPDPEVFGIAFIPYDSVKTIFQSGQSVNDLIFTVNDAYTYKDAEHAMVSKLESYGLTDIRARKDQKSHLLLKSEIDGMKGMAMAMPVVFLGVAAMIMVIMLGRLVEKQRGQIGVFKAFGLTDGHILLHYLGYAVLIGTSSGILGAIIGNLLVIPFTEMYKTMFNMPLEIPSFSIKYGAMGLILSLTFSLVAGYQGTKSTLKIEPAEAMRPPAPKAGSGTFIERVQVIWKRMSMISRIAVRNIFRNKGRTAFVFTGIVLTYAILGMPWAMKENMDIMVYSQFENVMTYDMKVDLAGPVKQDDALDEVMRIAGVERVEALLEVPGILYSGGRKKEVSILGIEEDSQMYHLYDQSGIKYELPKEGIVLSEKLADKLGVEIGGSVLVKSPYASDPSETVPVSVKAIIPQYLGLNAYMDSDQLMKLLGQPDFTTAVIANTSPEGVVEVRETFKETSSVFGVNSSTELMEKYSEMMDMMIAMLGIFIFIGILCGFSIVYASSMITLSERKRELASLLVIGLSHKEVKRVLALEQWYTAAAGFIVGMPVLKLMVGGMSAMMVNDVYTMPTEVSWLSFASAGVFTVIAILLAQHSLGKKITEIRLVEALSIRE